MNPKIQKQNTSQIADSISEQNIIRHHPKEWGIDKTSTYTDLICKYCSTKDEPNFDFCISIRKDSWNGNIKLIEIHCVKCLGTHKEDLMKMELL